MLLIGDELLSGRTQDVNLQTIAKFVGPLGVQIAEARVVADVHEEIVAAVNALRATATITSSPPAASAPRMTTRPPTRSRAAFGVGIDVRADARAILEAHYKGRGNLNEARLRMARIPMARALIANPGLESAGLSDRQRVRDGRRALDHARHARRTSGRVLRAGRWCARAPCAPRACAKAISPHRLRRLEAASTRRRAFGSYPWFRPEGYGVHLVARVADEAALAKAANDLIALITSCGAAPELVDDSA